MAGGRPASLLKMGQGEGPSNVGVGTVGFTGTHRRLDRVGQPSIGEGVCSTDHHILPTLPPGHSLGFRQHRPSEHAARTVPRTDGLMDDRGGWRR